MLFYCIKLMSAILLILLRSKKGIYSFKMLYHSLLFKFKHLFQKALEENHGREKLKSMSIIGR